MRLFDRRTLPSILENPAIEHFPKQMGAAARGMLLFARHHVAWAHGSAMLAPTLTYANATQRRAGKIELIIWKMKMSPCFGRMIIRTQAQIVDDPIRLYDFAGIHLPLWIPDVLEFAECLHELWSEHLG